MNISLYQHVVIVSAFTLVAFLPTPSQSDKKVIKDYLRRYGYGETETEEQLDTAVRKLQMFMNIVPVGFNGGADTINATLNRIKLPRCRIADPANRVNGNPPVIPPFIHSNLHWDSETINYNPLGPDQLVRSSHQAIQAWINTTPLNFVFNGDTWDITIEVAPNTSGLGNEDFGQSFPPPNGTVQIRADLQNEATILMHLIGHALGLEHVPGRDSIMNPYYYTIRQLSAPNDGDVAGIKSLYVLCSENQTEVNGLILTWPVTMKNRQVGSREVCPLYSANAGIPIAYRYCNQTSMTSAEWEEPTDIIKCLMGDTNTQVTQLSQVNVTKTNVVEVAGALAEISNNTAEVDSEGLNGIANTLVNIVDVKQPSEEVTVSVVATVNNVLSIESRQLNNTVDNETPSKILRSLERQLATLQLYGDRGNFSDIRENVGIIATNYLIDSVKSPLVFAKLTPSANEMYVGLNDVNTRVYNSPEEVPENRTETSISLPVEIIGRFLKKRNEALFDDNITIPITFTIYERSDNFLFTPDASVHSCKAKDLTADIQGHIISATVEGVKVRDLVEPVRIVINPSESGGNLTSDDVAHLYCTFWQNRNWISDESCKLEEVKPNGQIVCSCSHLTNFAVLLTPYGDQISHIAFELFNIIAMCLSIVGLMVTIVMYLVIPKLRNQPSIQVHMNFMVSLLALYVVFVIGIDMTSSIDACVVIAVLLHYLSLSTVFLMGAEAFTMFYLFVSVKGQQGGIKQIRHYVIKVAVVAWGLPLVIVVPIAASNYCQYYNEDYCFLPAGKPLYYGEILPIGIVILVNTVIFSLVTYKILLKRKFKKRGNNNAKKDANIRESVRQFYRVLSLFTVLGLSWICGVLSSIYVISFVFQVLFAVTTTLQGVFIFLLFCARHQDVLATWKRWAKMGRKKEHHGNATGSKRAGRSENATCPQTPTTLGSPVTFSNTTVFKL